MHLDGLTYVAVVRSKQMAVMNFGLMLIPSKYNPVPEFQLAYAMDVPPERLRKCDNRP